MRKVWKAAISTEHGPLAQTDVDLILTRMLQSGATWPMILRSIADMFGGEAIISSNDERRIAFKNARDSLDDAEAEMLELETVRQKPYRQASEEQITRSVEPASLL